MRAREPMRAWASRYTRLVYERTGNNKRQTCRELGSSYATWGMEEGRTSRIARASSNPPGPARSAGERPCYFVGTRRQML